MFRGNVDMWNSEAIRGWVIDLNQQRKSLTVTLHVDGHLACEVVANEDRSDLVNSGYETGRHGFYFDASRYISPSAKFVEITIKGASHPLAVRNLVPIDQLEPEFKAKLSQDRWTKSESAEGLTWGAIMTGDTFFDAISGLVNFTPATRIIEIGPGYGRLLRTLLDRGLSFSRYTGLELSSYRVQELSKEFATNPKIVFKQFDALTNIPPAFDLAISSSTFEHLYPDCSQALANLKSIAAPGGITALDVLDPVHGPVGSKFHGNEESHTKGTSTYVRIYAEEEIIVLHEETGLSVITKKHFSVGNDAAGMPINRLLIVARA